MGIQSKVIIPIFFIFSLLAGVTLWVSSKNQHEFVEEVIEFQTEEMVNQYFDSVNTLMITGAMDEREILRNKLLSNKNIVEARMVRGEPVNNLFGEGLKHELPADEIDKKALKGEETRLIHNTDKGRVLTIAIPFKAQENFRGTNCIECHDVPAGTVLGAARISYSLADVEKSIESNVIFLGKVIVSLFFGALIILVLILKLLAISRIRKFQKHIDNISESLDLTLSQEGNSGSDEIDKMRNAFHKMISNIRNSLLEVQTAVVKISTGSTEISQISEEGLTNSHNQKETLEDMAVSITHLSTSSKDIAENTKQNTESSARVDTEVSQGATATQEASQQITDLTNSINSLSQDVKELEEETHQIDSILAIIEDVTLKTQLLSFNASVEAARSGEHGKGFAVVADEIGQLALETKESTVKINDGIEKLNKIVAKVVETIESTTSLANEGNQKVKTSSEIFTTVASEIQNLNKMNKVISEATISQSETAEEMERQANSITTISEKTYEANKRTGELSDDFVQLAGQLEKLIQRFKL